MKEIRTSKQISAKKMLAQGGLFDREIQREAQSYLPGEWVIINVGDDSRFVGYINQNCHSGPQVKIVEKYRAGDCDEASFAKALIERNLEKAVRGRNHLRKGARLVYGQGDNLPGLIIDSYCNCVLIQIATAGIDRFRDEIKQWIQKKIPDKEIIFFDNENIRKRELLPTYSTTVLPPMIDIEENGIQYSISGATLQKNGYYYDHRNNRSKLLNYLENKKNLYKGLDLYCYLGSWGMHMLKAGIRHVDFVDQGDFAKEITFARERNGLKGCGQFFREDVFRFIQEKIKKEEMYDVIVCDPPAFSKKKASLHSAKEGYLKLYRNCIKILSNDGFLVAASCTHGISFDELSKIVRDAAFSNFKQVQLLDIGIQGEDHPFASLVDSNCYIKYLLFSVKNMGESHEH